MKHAVEVVAVLLFLAGSASAQVARVFLAGNGNDVNDCSNITTPCRSLQGAINQCPAKGEVIIVSSGGFGSATITKSLTVDAAPGVVAFNARTITVTVGSTDTVTLRHLILNGAVFGDLHGIRFTTGGTLHVEDSDIGGFAYSGVSHVAPGSSLTLTRCSLHDSQYGLDSQGSGATRQIVLDETSVHDNTNVGLSLSAPVAASVVNSDVHENSIGIGLAAYGTSGSPTAAIGIDNSAISGSANVALYARGYGGSATVYVSNSVIDRNANTVSTGITAGGTASVISFGNNTVSNNTTTTSFTSTVPVM